MTAGAVKKSPVIVVKKKRQIAPVTENVPAPAAQERKGKTFLQLPVSRLLSACSHRLIPPG
ncbi:hypothetical protein AHV57_21950 [Salmonella enterica]|nr:hypothetical protein [Salmonella enterica]